MIFQPTRPLRGATSCVVTFSLRLTISTHAPLAGRDSRSIWLSQAARRFQPTRPLRGATCAFGNNDNAVPFQPTSPLRGATNCVKFIEAYCKNFNPRAPCGARRFRNGLTPSPFPFQPTRPLRGATASGPPSEILRGISTHAPLAGRDTSCAFCDCVPKYFNPRAPCGARRELVQHDLRALGHFNPRAPCGARPYSPWSEDGEFEISTHAPLAGRDGGQGGIPSLSPYFNPRAPCGARPFLVAFGIYKFVFQPTRPLRGATFRS